MQKYLGYIIAVCLLIAFVLFRGCGPENVRVETEYIYDTTDYPSCKCVKRFVDPVLAKSLHADE